jgi:hypothetical protein
MMICKGRKKKERGDVFFNLVIYSSRGITCIIISIRLISAEFE